jgi:hypothetical protein
MNTLDFSIFSIFVSILSVLSFHQSVVMMSRPSICSSAVIVPTVGLITGHRHQGSGNRGRSPDFFCPSQDFHCSVLSGRSGADTPADPARCSLPILRPYLAADLDGGGDRWLQVLWPRRRPRASARMRPIPLAACCAATTTNALPCAPRPRLPGRGPPSPGPTPAFLAGHLPKRFEPQTEGQMRIREQGPRRHRGLPTAPPAVT